jgi:hypothetical protein
MSIQWLLGTYAKLHYFVGWLHPADAYADGSTALEFHEAVVNDSSHPSAACASDDGFDDAPLNLESEEEPQEGLSAFAEASRDEQQRVYPLPTTSDDTNVTKAAARADAAAEEEPVQHRNYRGADAAAAAPTHAKQHRRNAGSSAHNGLLQAEPHFDTDMEADTHEASATAAAVAAAAASSVKAESFNDGAENGVREAARINKRGSSTQQDSRKRRRAGQAAPHGHEQQAQVEATIHSTRGHHGAAADVVMADAAPAGAGGELNGAAAAAAGADPNLAAAGPADAAALPAPSPAAAVESSSAFKLLSKFLSRPKHLQVWPGLWQGLVGELFG